MWGIFLAACSHTGAGSLPFPLASANDGSNQENLTTTANLSSPEEVAFTNLTVENGLSQTSVECVFQDQQGYLWFCTHEGLDRFDGYEFVNFKHDPRNPDSLSDNNVSAITEDQDGSLWIGTLSGLDRLTPENGRLSHIPLRINGTDIDRKVQVTSLITDLNGDLWVGTPHGIFQLDLKQDRILKTSYFDFLDNKAEPVVGNFVDVVYQDPQGVIWVGGQHGLGSFNPDTNSFTWVQNHHTAIADLVIQAMIQIEPGVLLIGGEGLSLFNIRAKTLVRLKDNDVFPPFPNMEIGKVHSIRQDKAGMIWIGMETGLMILDPVTRQGTVFTQIQDEAKGIRTILSLLQDREGNIWAGTLDQGLFVYHPLRQKFSGLDEYIVDVIRQKNIWSLYEDNHDCLWVGIEDELLRIDRKTRKISHYSFYVDEEDVSQDLRIRAIIEIPSGDIWAGTPAGRIYVYDPESDSFIRKFANSIHEGIQINQFFSDTEGDIWVGTNQGLYRYQFEQDQFHHYLSDPGNPDTLSNDRVTSIQEGEGGVLWVGTSDGLNSFDRTTNRFSRFLFPAPGDVPTIGNAILSILPDQPDRIWLGGQSGGLYLFNPLTGNLTPFQDSDGVTAGMIFSILEDGQRNLWLSSQRGLSKFDPVSGVFTNYTHEDGLPGNEFNQGAFFQSPDGEMFFGGINGFLSFFPEDVVQNPYLPPIVLTEITQSGEGITSETSIDHLTELTLSWPENYFEFEFASLSYIRPENNQYAYYLDGIDPSWVLAGKNRNGRYVNLPGGKYTLHLIGSNNDGVWNTDGKYIRITVIPPIWQRAWFQAFIVFGLVSLAFAGYRFRVKNILSKADEMERLVHERTSDLSRINEQLMQEIAEREKAEKRLAQRIASEAILTERNRLAKDLHDAVTQTIFSASILSETLPHSLEANPEKGKQQIEELQLLTRGALAELRSLLIELRPEGLVKTDLKDLLAQLCKGITGRSGIPVELDCEIRVEIPSEVKITLYRIAQEALNNASRHADPSHIQIHCSSDQDVIRMSIRDDGKGFDYEEKLESRMGLGIMQERAADIGASLEVISKPGSGTSITIEWLFPENGDTDE
jgi:signal transduction histidine kinase/ligand-binding sensor domain-containing protein